MKSLVYYLVILLTLSSCGSAAPVADAGEKQTITLGETVTLDGTESLPKRLIPPTYFWSILEAPPGSIATINDASAENTTFRPDLVGTYIVQLIINNGIEDSAPSEITITVTTGNTIPTEPIATDSTGDVSLYELVPIENTRNATHVNFSLKYTIENSGADLVNIGLVVYGVDLQNTTIFTPEINAAIAANAQVIATVSFDEVLTIEEYDSITIWDVEPIIIY